MRLKKISIKVISIIMLVALVVSVVPLVIISFYAHPSADDFGFGYTTAQAWNQSGSFINVFKTAITQTQLFYKEWQGTYSGVFMMCFQPAIFGDKMYFLAPILLIFSLIFSNILLFRVLIIDYLKSNKWMFTIITSTVLIMTIQFMYFPVEGLYWYNGGIFYTFFYSLSLVLLSLLLLYLKSNKTWKKILYATLSIVLAFFIGGGNYTTALTTVIILVITTLVLLIRKNKSVIVIGGVALVALSGLIISMISPGNDVRQAVTMHDPNAIKAILSSFVFAIYSICNSTKLPVFIGWIFLSPFIYILAKRSKLKFKHPLLVVLLSFCVFSAQATPPLYAMGISIPERLINIIYYSYYLFVLVNLFYMLGWASRKFDNEKYCEIASQLRRFCEKFKQYTGIGFYAICILFACSSIGLCTVSKDENGKALFSNMPTSVSATYSLINGEASIYEKEYQERLKILKNPTITDVVVSNYSKKPFVLYFSDITENKDDLLNKGIAQYYSKQSVRIDNKE